MVQKSNSHQRHGKGEAEDTYGEIAAVVEAPEQGLPKAIGRKNSSYRCGRCSECRDHGGLTHPLPRSAQHVYVNARESRSARSSGWSCSTGIHLACAQDCRDLATLTELSYGPQAGEKVDFYESRGYESP